MFSRLERYLARLPDGADSYPDVVVKASTFTAAFADKPVPIKPGQVPAPIEKLIRNPPFVSAWVPEVQMVAIFKMIGDYHFEGRGGTPAFLEWVYTQNQQLLGGKLYRALFWFLSPETVFRGVEQRWGAFRRGTSLTIVQRSDRNAVFEFRYPRHLLDDEGLLAIGTALRVAGEAAGAKSTTIDLVNVTPTSGHVRLHWVPP
ncbi:MAG TPA: hypothetical protein PK156_19510 [Polyangium sp.]|nr:hypothetical protein [Polyangium sp.]